MTASPTLLPDASLFHLLGLARQARLCSNVAELRFLAVNDTHSLVPYRQAALWLCNGGVAALSGVVQAEANAPYVQWITRVCASLHAAGGAARAVGAEQLAPADAAEWHTWWPAHALMLPSAEGLLLLARDTAWAPHEVALLGEWIGTWSHAHQALSAPRRWRGLLTKANSKSPRWWQRRVSWAAAAALLALLVPVRLSVLAPGELVPRDPAVVSAPLDGVVARFAVKPNETVTAGQLLFALDDATLQSRLEVARQALATAETEYRQSAQLAVLEAKSKAQLSALTGKIEERRAEADYLRGQLERSRVLAPADGVALFDDPSEWVGKPVVTGERIMRIASPGDLEVEAWVAVGDAVPLPEHAAARLFLNASPLSPVEAQMRYMAFEAVQRPDGNPAYRVRATLSAPTEQRIGLKGTVKLSGGWVPAGYWALRRPLAGVRQFIGW